MSARSSSRVAIVAAVLLMTPLLPFAGEGLQEAQNEAFEPPRTEWGDPDFGGRYLSGPGQPMETPAGELWQPLPGTHGGNNAAFSRFFEPDPDAPPRPARITRPMIVDPPDGKIPLQPWAAERRAEIMARQDELDLLDPRVKCLPSALPRAHLPVGYNSYQILQLPEYILVLYEWNHLYRYIPLDGRPHVNADIHLGMGDSRGHWEGNTLVVDVTTSRPIRGRSGTVPLRKARPRARSRLVTA